MPIKTFEALKRILHFDGNSEMLDFNYSQHDELHKLRPIINMFNKCFSSIPIECCLAVDKQMFHWCKVPIEAVSSNETQEVRFSNMLCGASGYYIFITFTCLQFL